MYPTHLVPGFGYINMKSPSYRQAVCCPGTDCTFLDHNPDEPCWGQVDIAEETYDEDMGSIWVHACQGHMEYWYGEYIPESNNEQTS